ncbi:putative peroxisomal targeting signal receptor [Nadsonia fulvescens var. elongata DSM 6958]|uniref:Peroxin-7 n=1 Tax=Nadsonia fulvescens var. elongata DSM 6958 TaxID=857566 RepID=A0A1E3PHU0_9ASCO|nr:putative peroxisomal targeting signal receptor [Nadsonia fulvescens var. elongata DSM 6958]
MLSFRTTDYSGYATAYSPFFDSTIAVATAANYGLVGNGRLYIVDLTPEGIRERCHFDTQDGLFDLAWSETHENQIITANGDGSIKLFDLAAQGHLPTDGRGGPSFPLVNFTEHTKEVFSVNWNLAERTTFVSASWDSSIKIWSPTRPQSLLTFRRPVDSSANLDPTATGSVPLIQTPSNNITINSHDSGSSDCVFSAKFSPHAPSILASAHSNGRLSIWDIRSPQALVMDIPVNGNNTGEVLTLDWNKYRPTVLATGGVDRAIKIWDIRNLNPASASAPVSQTLSPRAKLGNCINVIYGHELPVRNVSWSPHSSSKLLSVSYDMTARVWEDRADSTRYAPHMAMGAGNGAVTTFDAHTEFVVGCDWSLWGQEGWCATTGWDEMLYVWQA